MAEDKQPFDDDFNADEFDAFDDEDFNFDDDEASFQFDDTEETETGATAGESSEYEFAGDEAYTEAEESAAPKNSPMEMLSTFIERLKGEEPKQLIKYGIGAAVALLLLIGGFIKLVTPSSTPAKTSAHTQSNKSSQSMGLSSLPQNNNGLLNNQSSLPSTTQPVSNLTETQNLGTLTPTSAIPAPTQTTPVITPATIPTQVQQPGMANNQQVQQLAGQNADLTKRVSDLESVVNQLNTQLTNEEQMNASNQAQIASLIKSIDSMQTQMAKLNNAMQTMVSAVTQASSNGQSGYFSPTGNSNASSNAADYYVQAIIPGRAWLKNSSGQIITVAPGDPVPGYGTVTNIDAQNGVVTTSSGTKIVFGIDEG